MGRGSPQGCRAAADAERRERFAREAGSRQRGFAAH